MTAAEELDKLKKLRDDGTITDEQYERARAKLEEEGMPVADYVEPEPAPPARDDARPERKPRRRNRDDDDDDGDYEDRLSPRARRKKVRELSMFLHLSLFAGHIVPFGGIIVPIVLWQTQKEKYPELDVHGKNAVNWIITSVLGFCLFVPLSFVFVGIPFLIALVILNVVFPILAAIKANEGVVWKYPLAITFVK